MRRFKESGVPWVPTLPESWGVGRLKTSAKITLGKMLNSSESERHTVELPYVRAANLSERSSISAKHLKRMWFSPKEAKKLALREDDVLLVEGGNVGMPLLVGPMDHIGTVCFQNSINRLRSEEDPKYLFYWMKFLFDSGYHLNNINTVSFPHLTKEKLGIVPFFIPPRNEQRAIGLWLDRKVGNVDSRLAMTGRKREMLRELKDSVLEECMLTGLRSKGKVPEHWRTVRIASLFREAADEGKEGLPMLSVSIHSGISDKELDDDEMDRKVTRSVDKRVYKRVRRGDLVYNQMRAWQGAFGTAKIDGLVSPAYVVARPRDGVNPDFIEHLLRAPSSIEEIRRRSRGITDFRLRLYWDQFKNIQVCLPPPEEQNLILEFVEQSLDKINAQLANLEQLEAMLKEHRRALIRSAVTGELDLSSFAVKERLAQAA